MLTNEKLEMNKFNGAVSLKSANLLSKLGSAEGIIATME